MCATSSQTLHLGSEVEGIEEDDVGFALGIVVSEGYESICSMRGD